MKKHEIFFSIIKLPLDFLIVFFAFFIARDLRLNHDLPYIVLPKQFISEQELLNFALFGSFLFITIFSLHSLYKMKISSSKIKEFFDIIFYSFYFFIFFSAIVYFARDFLYTKELPRLIILFTTIITIFFVILSRIFLNLLQNYLIEKGILEKRKIIILSNKNEEDLNYIIEDIEKASIYEIIGYANKTQNENNINYLGNKQKVLDIIKSKLVDEIIFVTSDFSAKELQEIWEYSRIYGIRYRYITNSFDITKLNTEISMLYKIPLIEIKNTPLDAWGRVIKRILDFTGGIIGIILFSPLIVFSALAIKIEDPKGPIIYKNKRVGLNGKEFNLYKFRYMKWEYCIKDSYGIKEE
ncbi:MAG: sugar transferase, partial [Candidatus Gracilibacteria bacterium]|nr:sugar transferase [Candidatus Gracilibacteria bacterium]